MTAGFNIPNAYNNITKASLRRHLLLNFALLSIPLVVSGSLSNNFELPKWLCTGFILSLLMMNEAFDRADTTCPKLPMSFSAIIGVVVLLQLGGIYFKNPVVWSDYLYYLTVFAGYTFFFFKDFNELGMKALKGYALSLLICSALVVPIGFAQLSGFPLLKIYYASRIKEGFASTMGNINYTSQFLAFSTMFFILGMALTSSRVLLVSYFLGIVLSLTYFSYLNTRSIIIALTLSVVWLWWRRLLLTSKRLLHLAMVCSVMIPISRYLIHSAPRAFADEARIKSASIRLDMWVGTLKMIADHPFGVGIDNFNFSFVPYRTAMNLQVDDGESILNPHNEFLGIAAESGVPVAILIFGTALYFAMKFLRRKPKGESETRLFDFTVAIMLLFFIEAVLQFPFDGQWVMVIFSLLISLVFSQILPKTIMPAAFVTRLAFGLGLMMMYLSLAWFLPMATLTESSDLEKARFSCEQRPQEWFACNRYAQALYKSGQIKPAEEVLFEELRRQPNNWFAMGLLGQIYVETGRKVEGCDIYKKVDLIFNGKSRTHAYIEKNCI